MTYFYPRPLRGGRHNEAVLMDAVLIISIHALCEEGDADDRLRGVAEGRISIHALCEEGDSTPARRRSWLIYFYPRPLRGGRPKAASQIAKLMQFLSTPSARRATCGSITGLNFNDEFLSTPSARRATFAALCTKRRQNNFYPRPLRGGRPVPSSETTSVEDFYPRPLRGGRHCGG